MGVQVYSKSSSGGPTFYKDGYTDRRGRFDYVSLSTGQLDTVARFAILVLSEGHGAVVKQASTRQAPLVGRSGSLDIDFRWPRTHAPGRGI